MFVRPSSLFFVAMGCASDGPPLTRLTRAWAAQTAEIASPALTATVVLGGAVSELCIGQGEGLWSEIVAGDTPPLPDMLNEALGDPVIDTIESLGTGTVQVTLGSVSLFGHDGAYLRLMLTPTSTTYELNATALSNDDGENADPARAAAYGQVALEASQGCAPGRSLVEGTALWIDDDDRTHTVRLPADTDLGAGVGFGTDVPYVPVSGTASWSARIAGQERTLTTDDAIEILTDESADGMATARWPSVVRGPDWNAEAIIPIDP